MAISATACEPGCLIYTLNTRRKEYVERGIEASERYFADSAVSNLGRRAKQLGYQRSGCPNAQIRKTLRGRRHRSDFNLERILPAGHSAPEEREDGNA